MLFKGRRTRSHLVRDGQKKAGFKSGHERTEARTKTSTLKGGFIGYVCTLEAHPV